MGISAIAANNTVSGRSTQETYTGLASVGPITSATSCWNMPACSSLGDEAAVLKNIREYNGNYPSACHR
jgi:hypothetical protein